MCPLSKCSEILKLIWIVHGARRHLVEKNPIKWMWKQHNCKQMTRNVIFKNPSPGSFIDMVLNWTFDTLDHAQSNQLYGSLKFPNFPHFWPFVDYWPVYQINKFHRCETKMSEYGANLQSNVMELVKCKSVVDFHTVGEFTWFLGSILINNEFFFTIFICRRWKVQSESI